ncbi:thioredoxin family protein [Ancylomarina longa]|uniref:Thioredoxin n=1 Tax=Ancylomarina longa TaxID=2487017 RepID=A0A434AGM6_9BACT|nr:thioredoxin family protein [Ancylomarina longa]RUT73524.1 thioredoxin [Ancylomarina longa]
MKKLIFLLLFSFFNIGAFAQNKTKLDTRIQKEVLSGQINLDAFNMDICKAWYTPEHETYQIKKGLLRKLKQQNLNNIRILIVLGSWCHDSHQQVPRFIKILEAISFPFEHLDMNALDTYKHSPDFDAKTNGITRVPTIIIYKKDQEIGRIIEHPKKSLERDLLHILNNK